MCALLHGWLVGVVIWGSGLGWIEEERKICDSVYLCESGNIHTPSDEAVLALLFYSLNACACACLRCVLASLVISLVFTPPREDDLA